MKLVLAVVLGLCLFQQGTAVDQVCLMDVALVIDHSGSIRDNNPPHGPDNWGQVIEFVKAVVRKLKISPGGTHMAAVSYGNDATLDFDLNDYTTESEVLNAVGRIKYGGGNTNTTGGLREMRVNVFSDKGGDRSNVRDMCILITDGVPTREETILEAEVARIKDQGIVVLAVGVTDQVDESLLKRLVTSDDYYFKVGNFGSLGQILDKVISQACVTIVPPKPTLPAPAECAIKADIVFVLDSSGSIEERNFHKMKSFVSSIIADMDLEGDKTRVGVLIFSNNAHLKFHLNKYRSRSDASEAVDKIQYIHGTTNTAEALSYVRNSMFNSGNGDRQNVPNIVVVMTDGSSNDKRKTQEEAFKLKSGAHVIVIGIGGWLDPLELSQMASAPYSKNKIDVPNFNALQNIKQRIINMICDNRDECKSSPCRNGGQCINGIDMYWCRCNTGYAGTNCESRCRVKADIAFALDASGSVGKTNFVKQVDFVKRVIYGLNLNGDSRVAAETYANSPNIQFYLNKYTMQYAVYNGLSFYYTGGKTNTASAIDSMRNDIFTSGRGDRGNVRNIGVIITDGRSNDRAATLKAATKARKSGITLLTVGVGNNLDHSELLAVANYPSEKNYFKSDNFDNLNNVASSLISAICDANNECSSNPCKNNGRCVDLIGGYECVCQGKHSGPTCERGCSSKLDIVFVIDSSGSIRSERFPKVLNFVNSIVDQYEVSSDATRVGAVVFSDSASVQFQLNAFKSKQDVMSAVSQIKFIGGRTNTAGGLQLMKDNMFTSGNGDRSDVPNLAIVITDGNSNINQENTIPYAIDARIKGVHVIVLAIGTMLNELELRGMASMPVSKNYYVAKSWRNLPDRKTEMIRSTCDDANECSSNPCKNGGRCKDLLKRFWCVCSGDYSGVTCSRRCTKQMDITFILDLSGSVDTIYDLSVSFIREVVNGLPFQNGRTRVALISFSTHAKIEFYLNKYQSKQEVLNALSFRAAGGKTNTQEAINRAYNDVFSSGRGDRSGVQNIAIVVTDGRSNVNRDGTKTEAEHARQNNVKMYVAAVTDRANIVEVNDIASDPDSTHVVKVRDNNAVSGAARELLDHLCE